MDDILNFLEHLLQEEKNVIYIAIILSVLSSVIYTFLLENIVTRVRDIFWIVLSWLFKLLSEFIGFIANVVIRGVSSAQREILKNINLRILFILQKIRTFIDLYIGRPISDIVNYLNSPKWYYSKPDAIDPGLIEVSVAVSGVLIALSSYISPEGLSNLVQFRWLQFFMQFIPTLASINLLDRYVKNKGSKSYHVLMSPIVDGPFFLLGWSIIIGFIFISIVVFQIS